MAALFASLTRLVVLLYFIFFATDIGYCIGLIFSCNKVLHLLNFSWCFALPYQVFCTALPYSAIANLNSPLKIRSLHYPLPRSHRQPTNGADREGPLVEGFIDNIHRHHILHRL